MSGGRPLYAAEKRGHWWGYQLRIRNNAPWDSKQWWVFDWRTKTIRMWADRRMVISNQYGQRCHQPRNAYARPFRREAAQKLRWFRSSR